MPKDKERSINPAAAHRKAEKQKALKKGKAAIAAQRTERLAHRNPDKIQQRIGELKAIEESAGQLPIHQKKALEELERELARVRKAKEAIGDKRGAAEQKPARQQPQSTTHGGGNRSELTSANRTALGKRGRGREWTDSRLSSDTDDSVKDIPMPRDTPPPVPRRKGQRSTDSEVADTETAEGANSVPNLKIPPKPQSSQQPPVQIVYESKPVIRDLRKEVVAFVPTAVRNRKIGDSESKPREDVEQQRVLESQEDREKQATVEQVDEE